MATTTPFAPRPLDVTLSPMGRSAQDIMALGSGFERLDPRVLEQISPLWTDPREIQWQVTGPNESRPEYAPLWGGRTGYVDISSLQDPSKVSRILPATGEIAMGGPSPPPGYEYVSTDPSAEGSGYFTGEYRLTPEGLSEIQRQWEQFSPLREAGWQQVAPFISGKLQKEKGKFGWQRPELIRYHPEFGLIAPSATYSPYQSNDFLDRLGDFIYSAAPGVLVGLATGGLGLPGLLGGGALGNIGAGAITGGLTSAITGGDPLKGALSGALGGGLGAAIPAGSFVPKGSGPVGEFLGAAARRAVIGGIRTGIMGGDPVQGALSGALGPLAGVARATGLLGQQPQAQARPIPRQMQAEPVSRGPLGTVPTGGGLPAQASQQARYATGRLPRGLSMGAGPGLRGLS